MATDPLAGLRILDLTSVVVGPVCTARLAQFGAEVIKLESPEGDLMRGLGGQSPTGEHSGTYLHLNRGKRNICCDLKQPGARAIIERLLDRADVVIANMRPAALARLGLDADSVRHRDPSKIHCLITGYGTDGPYAGYPTYDSVVQAASGVAGLMAKRDGRPAYVPLVLCDHIVGEIAAGAVLAAVLQQRATGVGASIEVPMFETMSAFVLQEHLAQQSFVPPIGPAGDQRLLNSDNRPVRTRDGWIAFTVNTDKQVSAFLDATDRSALKADPRFVSVRARADNVGAWFEIRGAPLDTASTEEWLAIFRAADIAAMPCHDIGSLCSDVHLETVGLLADEDHPTEGRTRALRSTIRFDGATAPPRPFAQPKGWDSHSVASEIGFSPDEIEGLMVTGALVAHSVPPTSD